MAHQQIELGDGGAGVRFRRVVQAKQPIAELDLAIAQHRARLDEITALLGNDKQVSQARQQLDAANQALKPWQTRARDLDLEIKSLIQKIQQTDRKLYSGKVGNPKELKDMQSELVSLKRRQSQLEDEMLEAMVHSD